MRVKSCLVITVSANHVVQVQSYIADHGVQVVHVS